MKKLTPWFPAKIKPVRPGVYAVSTPSSEGNKFSYFDRRGWRLCASNIEDAHGEVDWPTSFSSMNSTASKWRGLTKEAK